MKPQKPQNKLFRLLTAAIFLFAQLNPAWAALTTHSVDADFAGSKLRLSDTDTTTAPKLETYYQESAADPYTVGLWHFDGNANDSSGKSHTGTLVDTATVSGSTQFMGNVLSLDGAGDYVSVPDSEDWNFGSGDFTIDTWVKFNTNTGNMVFFHQQTASNNEFYWYINHDTDSLVFVVDGPAFNFVAPWNPSTNTWYHVALTRSGNDWRYFVDGVQIGSTLNAQNISNKTGLFYVGIWNTGVSALNGYLDEYRIVKGRALIPEEIKAAASRKPYAVYTSPAIDAGASTTWDTLSWSESGVRTGDGETLADSTGLVAQWNFNETSGVTADNAQGAAALDGTLANFASTASQDQAAGTGWTANNKKWGAGALMFDGTNDYVSVPDSEDWNFGSGDFSIDFWVKTNNTGGLGIMGQTNSLGNGNSSFVIRTRESGSLVTLIRISTDGTNWALALGTTVAIDDGIWHNVSVVRNGTTVILYIDGKNVASGTLNGAIYNSTTALAIGRPGEITTLYYNGILDSTRIYKGRALSADEILSNYNAGNIEFQTRSGTDATPDDGIGWEAWKPTTSETQLLSMDSDKGNWNASGLRVLASSTAFNYTGSQQTYTVPTGVVSITIKMWGAGGGGGVNVGENGGGAGYAEGILSVTPGENLSILVGQGGGVSGMDVGGGGGGGRSAVRRGSTELLTAGGGGGSGGGLGGVGGGTSGGDGAFTYKGYGGTQIAGGAGSSDGGSAGTQYTGGNARSGGLPNSSSAFGGGGSGDGNSWEWYGGGGGGGYFGGGGGGYNGGGGGGSGYIGGVTGGKNMAGGSGVTPGNSGDSDRAGAGVGGVGCLGSQPSAGAPGTNGRVIIYTAISNPANELNIKMEGTGSLKVETGKVSADPYTVALWHFEETSGTGAYIKDATANANHATPTGTTVVDGIFGKGRSFNGTSDVLSVGDTSTFKFLHGAEDTSGFKWSADFWVKMNTFSDYEAFFGTGPLATGVVGMEACLDSSRNLTLFITYGVGGQNIISATAGTYPNDSNWHHIAFTYDQSLANSNFKAYIDGALSGSGNKSGNTPSTANSDTALHVGSGGNNGSPTYFLNGSLDEFRILKGRALSADEIAETYRMGANHRISRTITANVLSTSNTLPFYVAADRPGTYLEATIGESPVANYEADANTVLFLHGDEIPGSTSIKDSSFSGKAITANGNARTSGNGKIGNSLYFDGTGDYLSIGDTSTFKYLHGDEDTAGFKWTIDLWYKANSFAGYSNFLDNFAVDPTTKVGISIGVGSDRSLWAYVSNVASVNTPGTIYPNDTINFHHIAYTYDQSLTSNNLKVYLDGVLVGANTKNANTPRTGNATHVLNIGRYNNDAAGGYYLNGYLDELRIIRDTALTPDQIRQAYEYGLRAHPITIDFAAKLDSANPISGSGDTSFTVDATAYGLSQKGANLYPGDKIIIRENIDGTEYIVQGTAKTADAATGAVTVVWDSGLTFPSGFSANASVFKWQREYFDLSGSLASQRDAITNLTIRPTNGAEGRTIYLDDFRKAGDYLTAPASSSIASSANRYLQYRAIVTTSDPAVSPSLTGVTVNNTPLSASYLTVTHNDYAALAGDVETITITAKDVNGNVFTTYAPATTVSITKTESGTQAASASLSKTSLSSADFASGVATITLSDTEAENIEVIATDASNTAVTGTSLPVAFSPAAASKIVFTSNAQTLTANTASAAYTVAVRDQYDNLRSGDAIVLNLASTSTGGKFDTASGGAFNGTVTSITTSGGTGTFYYKDTTAGSPTLTVSKTGLTSATQGQTVNFGTVSPTVTPASYKAGATANNTLAWTSSALPQNGKIELDFPVGYDLSGTLSVSGNTNATVSTSGNTLIITLGTAIAANSPVSLEVSGIKNPSLLGSTGTYALRTKNASGTQIDQGTAPANTIIAPTLTLLTPSAANISLTGGNAYDITWNYNGEISNSLKLFYSTDGTNYSNTIASGESNDGAYTWTVPFYPGAQTKVKIEDTFYQKLLETSQAQFQSGTFANAQVSGSGNSAGVGLVLDPSAIDFNQPTIAAGYYHTVGLKTDGTVVAVGGNGWGQLNVSAWTNIKSIAAGRYHTVGLKTDGTVVAVGDNGWGQLNVSAWTNIKSIAAGSCHTIGLKTDGTVVAVGSNVYGEGNVSAWTNIKSIAAGYSHTIGLKTDGTVVAVGWNNYGECNVSAWTNIKAIAAGQYHTVGFKTDGTVVAVGGNGYGQLNVSAWTNIKSIAAGYYHTVGLKTDGTVVAVGRNDYGEGNVSAWTNIKAIAAGYYYTVGLKTDGTVVAVGYNGYGQCNVSGWTNIKQPSLTGEYLSSGIFTSAALDTGGNLEYGKLNWSATVPSQSGSEAVKLQLSASADGNTWGDFVGPDGTVNTYFTTSGTDIPTSFDTKRYIKYKAYLSTADVSYTPSLNDVSVTFTDNNAADSVISDVSDNPFTITVGGALSVTSVVPASTYAGIVGNVSVSFTTAHAIPADGKVLITFPAGFMLNSGAATTATSSTMDGTLAVSASGQVLTLTRSGGSQQTAGAESITLTNIKNPVPGGSSGTFAIQTTTSSGPVTGLIDQDLAVAAKHIIGTLTSPAVSQVSYKAGAASDTTISFTTISAVPAGGKIELDFPVGYDLSGTLAVSGNTNATVSTSGNTLIITLGTAIAANSPVSLVVSGIKNPLFIGSTGAYALRTKDASAALIDEGTAAPNTITAPTLTLLTPSATNISLVGGNAYDITWNYNGEISNSLKLSYSTDGTNYSNTIATGESNDGAYTWTVPFYPGAQTKVKIEDTFYQKLVETNEAQFNTGIYSSTALTGTGNSAGVGLVLDTSAIDFNQPVIAAGYHHTIGLKTDGTVVAVGRSDQGQLNVSGWTNIKAIAGGSDHTIGLKTDGTVVAVGYNYWGQLNVSGWTNIKAIAAGNSHTIGLKTDGTVVAVGRNDSGEGNVGSWTGIKAIAAGDLHTVGLRTDGTVVAVGYNGYDQLNVGSWTGIKAIAAGDLHTVGLRTDGTVVAVGNNNYGQLNVGSWTGIKAIAAGGYHTVGLRTDGTVVAVGPNGDGRLNVTGWTNIKAIAARSGHTVGLRTDGTVVAVGDNYYGQLNVSGWTGIKQPLLSGEYFTSGTFTSAALDTVGNLGYGALSWNATLPPQIGANAIKFHVSASADNSVWTDFIGPDGTASTYFTASGADIPASLDGQRYIKYKAYLSTADQFYTPSLNDVSVTFTDNNAADSVISDVSDNPFTITVGGALSVTSVVPASTYAGIVGNVSVSFTTAHAIPADGKVLITFPAGFMLNSGAATTATSSTMDGTLAVSASGQVLTLTRSGGSQQTAGAESITLTNIKNPSPGGSSGTFAIQTTTSSGPVTGLIDQDLAVAAKHIIGTLTSPAVSQVSYKAGAASDTTISFTTISAVPAGGKIELDFPVGYDLSGTLAYVSGNNGTTLSVSGNTLTLTLGLQISASTAASIVVSGIKSPQLLGLTGAYPLRTKDSMGVLIDEGTASANTLIAPAISLLTPSDMAIKLYAGQPYEVTWSYDGGTSNNIKLSYSANGGSSYLKTIAQSEANDNTYTWTVPYDTGTNMKVKVEETFYQKLLDTSDAQFNAGAYSSTVLTGTGNSAGVGLVLDPSTIDFNQLTIAATGESHTVGLKTDGTVVAVGSNYYGQLNVSAWTNIKSIAAGQYHTVGLKTDGTVVGVGRNDYGQLNVSAWANIKAIAAGSTHTVGLKTDGTVVAVGWNPYGQLNVSAWTNIKSIATGESHTVGLKTDGTVVAVGSNYYGQLNVSAWTNIKSIAGGYGHAVGLKTDGTVVAVGYNGYGSGQCNVSGWANIKAIAAGSTHTVGLKTDGTVVAVGWNFYGQLNVSGWTNIKAIATGSVCTVGLKTDGTVVALGNNPSGQLNVSGWTGIKQPSLTGEYLSSGIFTSAALDSGGNLEYGKLSWGAAVPSQSGSEAVKLQLSASADGNTWGDFVGTDGTASTYFTTSGTDIPTSFDTKRYIKYKAYLSTADLFYTPSLNDVSISFSDNTAGDRLISDVSNNTFEITRPEITITAPGNAESDPNFRWIAARSYEIKWKTRGKTSESWTIEGQWLDDQAGLHTTAILDTQTTIANSSFDGSYYHYSYTWTIPVTHTLTNSAYIRITAYGTDVNNAAVTDIADSTPYFKIVASPQIALIEPISGAEWFINSANTIKWTMTEPAGDTNNKTATLQYAADSPNFANWVTVTAAGVNNENSQNSFFWTINKASDLPAGAIKLKVFDNAMASTTDTTAWSFKISNPAITVSAPLSGAVWRIGSTPEIKWSTTAGVSGEVKIEYFDGTNWNTVMESEGTANDGVVANDGGFVWTVPNIAPLTAAKIRISDAQAGSPTYYQATIESSNLEIAKPLFTISLPTQSPLRRGGSYTFSWTDDGTMGTNLDVLYAPTGTSFSSIKTQGSFSQDKKSWTWSLPVNTAVPQTNAKFQVKDNSSPFGEGTSLVFSLDKQRLTFDDSTVSGVSWPVGSQHTIGWSAEGEVTGLYVYYYKGASNIATIDQTANNNALPSGYTSYTNYPKTYSWTIANDDNYLASGTAKVKISAKTPLDAAVISTSAAFTVREPYLTVSLPSIVQNSGKWVQGDSIAFNWSADGYLTNNGQLELAYAALSNQSDNLDAATWVPFATVNISGASVNSGSFNFRPSDYNIPAGSLALQVRDTNVNRPLSKARSAVFEVSTEPYIGILAPLSVPAWRADTDQVIQWQGAGSVSSALKIEYSTDNSAWYLCKDSANVTAENLASIGSFSWRVPAAIKDNTAYIRIMDTQRQVTQMNPTGITAAIKGISLTDYPGKTAGESFTVRGTKTITWSPAVASSAQAKVKIEYSVDASHNTWSPVTESEGTANDGIVSDDGSFDWTIPDVISATAKIRVGSVSAGVSAASDNNFKIIGSLEVSAPAASANWIISTTQTVSWNALKGTFANVKLQYSPDNGVSWKSMSGVLNAATTTANNGSYSWSLPDDYSATAKIRVYEENGLSNTAESSLFTIASPQISISQPSSSNNGNSALTISEPYDLKWTTTGSTGTNNLELKISYDNQANWSVLEAAWPNTSPKSITPTSTSVQAWVKITEKSTTHPGAVATAGPFTVLPTPQITLSSPALNSAWTMGKQYEIKWDTQGLVFNTLRISYTLDAAAQTPVWVDIISGQSNTKSFYWTVSDLTSTLNSQANAKIRITDDTKGTVGYSDLFTISIPSMSVVRPQGGEVWAVGDSAPVKWSYNGAVIGPLSLQYDASGVLSDASPSIVANAAKTGQTSGTYTYNWSVPSGAQTSSVKARVKDSQRPNSSADSAASFEVIAAPTIEVTSPVDGDIFVIQDAMTVNWKVRGLSANDLSIEYWDDADLDNIKDADETLYTLASGVSRGSSDTSDEYSGKYTGTQTITLPDNVQVSANLKLRVRDPARGYEGLAAGHFRIRGGFELRDETNTANALASSSEWKANTAHIIKWYNKGSFANVKLEYATSSNGTSWGTYTSIIATLANSPGTDNISSYSWTAPDPHLSSYPDEPPQFYYVKLKITNLADTSVFTESPAFKIGYYTVTWKVKDYDTLTLLDSLTVSSTYAGTTYWRVNNGALTSTSDARYSAKTYPRRYPYGVFSTFWSKDGYGERSDNDRSISADTEITVLLESAASAQTEYKIYAGFAYNEDTDKLKINSWLEKKGTLITSADADVGVGGDGYVKIYDGETLKATLTDSTVDSNGNYWFEAANVVKAVSEGGLGLESGKTYFARMGIWYRSREYQSGATFEVTISKSLKAVTDEIKTMSEGIKTDVASITSMVSTEAAVTRSELKSSLDSGTAAVKEKLASEVSDLKAQTAKILTAAETTIPEKINTDLAAAIKSDVKPHIKSGILNRDNVVKTGQSLTIRYRTETGKAPTISIYNSKNALMVSGTVMTEVSGTGIYEYTATFTASWGTGDFSVVCSESSLGTVDAMVITVIKHTLDEVAGMTSSVMGSTSSLSDFKGMGASLVNIDAQFKALEQSLSGVGQNIINKVSETKGVVSEMESVYNQLANLSAQIKSIGATKNVNLEKLYEVSQEKKEDIIYLKNKAEELKAVMEINKKMTENVAKKPIVQSWFEYR